MAKIKTAETRNFAKKTRKKRPGVHAKTKTSKSGKSKNYKKAYQGQGKN
jgi:hypothetical protein